MDDSQRDQQLASWLDGKLSSEASAELLAELRNDAVFRENAAKALVVRRVMDQKQIPEGDLRAQVVEMLRDDVKTSLTGQVISALQNSQAKRRLLSRMSAILAAAAIVILGFFLALKPESDGNGIRVIAAADVGTLDIEALEQGREVKLRQGLLELALNRDTQVIFEGPAIFRVATPKHIWLSSGRCFARMTKGQSGLLIETPSGKTLDLGTEFAIDVPSPKKMIVHVFDGSVEVSDDNSRIRLTEGKGIALTDSKLGAAFRADPGLFVSRIPNDVAAKVPFLYWSFDENAGTNVVATGKELDHSLATGVLVSESPEAKGPASVTGVAGNALEFNGSDAWIGTQHPGIPGDEDCTFACWVKLPDRWDKGDSAPLVAWGMRHPKRRANTWTLSVQAYGQQATKATGRLRLKCGGHTAVGRTDLNDGRWHHVAAVAMGGTGGRTILLYVDGQIEPVFREYEEPLPQQKDRQRAAPIQFGRSTFRYNQFFHGSLDEAYLFSGALSSDEIRQLMEGEDVPQ